jgi:hypothetical protein
MKFKDFLLIIKRRFMNSPLIRDNLIVKMVGFVFIKELISQVDLERLL